MTLEIYNKDGIHNDVTDLNHKRRAANAHKHPSTISPTDAIKRALDYVEKEGFDATGVVIFLIREDDNEDKTFDSVTITSATSTPTAIGLFELGKESFMGSKN